MHGSRQHPADGVADVQHERCAVQLEDGGDPHQPQQAAAHKAHHHGQHAVAKAAQAAGQRIHDAAQQVGAADHPQALVSGGDHRRIRGVEVQQLGACQHRTAAQHHAGHDGAQQAVEDNTVQVLVLACAHVLAGKGDGSLRKGVHGGIDEALQIGGGRTACHHRGAEGVDGRLDDHVGQAEHGALQTGRQADKQNLLQGTHVEAQMMQIQMQRALLLHQHPRHHAGGNGLTDDGSQRHACHAHGKANDEHKVQHHVDETGCCQTVQRALGVAHGAQQRTAEVVQHGHGHPDEINFKVQRREVDHILRAAHQLQQPPGCKEPHHSQQHAADKAQRHRGLHRVLYAAVIFCAKAAGRHHVCAQRKPYEQVHQQVDEGAVGADGGQCGAARKAAHDHYVRSVEQQLQNAGSCQRDGEQDDLLEHRAAGKVSGAACLSHEKSTSFLSFTRRSRFPKHCTLLRRTASEM